MMFPHDIETQLRGTFGNAHIEVLDTTGTLDHFEVMIESPLFKGKSLIEQHRLVKGALHDAILDGRIHAISIKTKII